MNRGGLVLIAAPVHASLISGLQDAGYTCKVEVRITQESAFHLVKDCVGIITSTRLQLNKELLDAAPALKWIGRMGSGMEVIDLDHAAQKGIYCFGSPEGNCNAVAEHAVGMLLSLIRRIRVSGNQMQQGTWLRDENRGIELEGKTIGIIGFGHTGRALAHKLSVWDMRILAYDKYPVADVPGYVTVCPSLQCIYQEADIVSFHVPFASDTMHYLNESFVSAMIKPFILLNTSRGAVVSIDALFDAMKAGKVSGACLDVFEKEPVSGMTGDMKEKFEYLMGCDNMIVTPHIAGYTFEALEKMSKALLDKVLAI